VGLILDSDLLIRHERTGRSDFFTSYAAHGDAFISAITVSELLLGVHLADSQKRRSRRLAFVEGLLNLLPVFDFTSETARIHAEIRASLRQRGALIGAHDLIVAATAVQHGCAVATGNHREFNRVPGLEVIPVEHE
jgi:predicted nucleic acid-binding protein